MVYPQTHAQPASGSLSFQYSEIESAGLDQQVKFVPKNLDGTIFDCSETVTSTIEYDNGGKDVFRVSVEKHPTVVLGDATGIILAFPGTDVHDICAMGASSGNFYLRISEGVNLVPCAVGSWTAKVIP